MKIPALVLLVLVAAPVASASWSVESSDTGAGQLTVWNDYWAQRRSHYGDVLAFNVSVQVPEPGSYSWSLPSEAGSLPNPLRGVFVFFEVRDANGVLLGDLVEDSSLPSSFGAREEQEFHVSFRMARLSPAAYEQVRQEVATSRAHFNQIPRPDEVHGWIRLEQASSDAEPSSTGASVQVQHAIDLALVFELPGHTYSVEAVGEKGTVSVVVINGQRYAVVEGPEYEANDDGRAVLTATGELGNRSIQFFLDEVGKPLLDDKGQAATWLADDEGGLVVRLPAGRHRLIYLVPLIDGEPGFTGTITLHGLDGDVLLEDDVHYAPEQDSSPWWLLAVVVILVTAVAGVLISHRLVQRSDEPSQRRTPSPASAAGHHQDPVAERVEGRPVEVLRF